jgi:hypothetical protein
LGRGKRDGGKERESSYCQVGKTKKRWAEELNSIMRRKGKEIDREKTWYIELRIGTGVPSSSNPVD